MSGDPSAAPRAVDGRAPDVFRRGAWVPMRCHRDEDEVDFAIVGTGAGGGVLAAKLAEAGFSVVALDAGAYFRPLEDFASDELAQDQLYWTAPRVTAGRDPIALGSNNSGCAVGGSTVHFTMVTLRFRPEWFEARGKLGYARDWPVRWAQMEPYYREAEEALKVSGPVRYPWGPPRARYPYRAHELNAAARVLVRGAERLGVAWAPTPLATLSAPRGEAHPCVYRGFCKYGCSTNAKQSVLVTWIPRALAAGAEIRDLAMVGRIELDARGRAARVLYHRHGAWRGQRARHVVVAGYSIETPRLLLNSACAPHPQGLGNDRDRVGRGLMVHANDAVWGTMDEEVRWYKGPPSLAICEHWNYADQGKDFPGGYCFMSQGPLPIDHAKTLASSRGLWGAALRQEMTKYNHMAGLKIVGEVEASDENRVELADQTDAHGLPVAKVTFGYSNEDRKLKKHARAFMQTLLEAAGAKDLWQTDDSAHLMGGCPMGDDPRDSVTDAIGRVWDTPNLWICDGSLMPTGGGVNPSLTIMATAARIGDAIAALARRGEL